MDAQLDRNTRGKKAQNLASNVLGNEDSEVAASRAQWNTDVEKLVGPGTSWSAADNMKKT